MARRLLIASAGRAAAAFLPPWLVALCMVIASVGAISFAVFLCGRRRRSSRIGDDPLKKMPAAAAAPARKPMPASAAAPSSMARSAGYRSTGGTSAMYGAAFFSSTAMAGGCGHHGFGGYSVGGGCGGGGGC